MEELEGGRGGYGKCLVRSPIVMHVLSGGQLTKLRNQHFLISGPSPGDE